MRSILLFKRDLRIEDNKTLFEAFKNSDEIIPVFIFNKKILEELNSYNQKLGFIVESIKKLSEKIKKLYVFYGNDKEVLEFLILKYKPNALFTAQSFTWSGEKRNNEIKKICNKYKVKFIEVFDNFLVDFRKIGYSKIFSQFYKKWINLIDNNEFAVDINKLNEKILDLDLDIIDNLIKKYNNFDLENKIWKYNFGFIRLQKFNFRNYDKTRNFPGIDGTSKLSPYIRFGIISIRKIYNKIKNLSEAYVKELAWREFWYHIRYYFTELNNLEFQEKRRNLSWENNEILIEKFLNAQTGYPIVDAGIIQLKTENWIHNRVRMILANFLTKDLLVDWRIGEKFFKDYLLDYDEVVNVGNWQWCASVGPDPKQFRIFNPILQSQKFDPDCVYIKKYIPDLKYEENYKIHNPLKYKLNYYPPIINHFEAIKKVRNIFFKI